MLSRRPWPLAKASAYHLGAGFCACASTAYLDTEAYQRLSVKARSAPTEGKCKNGTVYEAYLDGSYRNWIIDNINERSGRGMRQLKQAIVEIFDYEHRYGKLFEEPRDRRTSYMALDPIVVDDSPAGPEQDLVCVLDTGCNVTCHGDRWLRRYVELTRQEMPELEQDHGGGFRGIGGRVQSLGVRELSLCLELAGGGLAHGELRSVELGDSDTPLLLSLETQRRLGLVLDLNREVAHSQALDRDLRLIVRNGLLGLRLLPGCLAYYNHVPEHDLDSEDERQQDDPEQGDITAEDGEVTEGDNGNPHTTTDDLDHGYDHDNGDEPVGDVGFLAIDELREHDEQAGASGEERHRGPQEEGQAGLEPALPGEVPRGCRTFLMEIFAGCAMLSTLAHYSGLPVSEPIDILYDPLHDLRAKGGRDLVETKILEDDPCLLTFAPVCGTWSTWQRVNMAKSPDLEDQVQAQRQEWKPVIRWMAKVATERMKKGRKVLIENPKGSELWNLWDMLKLLGSEQAVDSSSLEPLEKINIDLCAYGLKDPRTNMPHRKPKSIATCSQTLKAAFEDHGKCPKNHQHLALEGGDRCRHAQSWTEEFCEEVICAHLCDLDQVLVRSAFPAEARLEDEDGEVDNETDTLDAIFGEEDLATGRAQGRLLDEQNNEDEEQAVPEAEALEAEPMRARRTRWRQLPQAARIAVRRLHTMTGHASPSAMQRLLRTAGGDPAVI